MYIFHVRHHYQEISIDYTCIDIHRAMAVMLGKRKRRVNISDSGQQSDELGDDDLKARFQRAFEAKFRPLEAVTSFKNAASAPELRSESDSDDDHDDGEEDDDRWSGLSSENDEIVEVVRHDAVDRIDPETQRQAMRSYMVGRYRLTSTRNRSP